MSGLEQKPLAEMGRTVDDWLRNESLRFAACRHSPEETATLEETKRGKAWSERWTAEMTMMVAAALTLRVDEQGEGCR